MSTKQIEEEQNQNQNKDDSTVSQSQSSLVTTAVRTLSGPSDLFDSKKYPGLQETEWQRFFGTLNSQKMKYIAKLAEQTEFKIRIKNDKGEYVTITKRYQDPTVEEWQSLEDLRAQYADMLREDNRVVAKIAAWAELNKDVKNPQPPVLTDEEKAHRRKCSSFLANMQKNGAKIFLDMSEDQFLRSDYRSCSDAVDACNHRTQYFIREPYES